MSDDLIRRRDAIKALCDAVDAKKHGEYLYTDEFCKAINAIQSAGRTTWMPCSERLPEEEGIYLVTATNYIFDTEEIAVGTCYFNIEYGFSNNRKILAWMPLPKPWK